MTTWNQFEEAFISKFGEEKTPAALVLDLSHMKMHEKDKVKDLN